MTQTWEIRSVDPACGTAGFLIDTIDYLLAKYSETPTEIPIYGEDWLEKREQTLADAKQEMPNLQTYQKGIGDKIPDWNLLEQSIFGYDVSRQMMRISMMNLVLHGIRNARLKRANVLSEQGELTDDDLGRRYQVMLANPPFAGQLPKDSIRRDLPTKSKKSELLFLGAMMQSLAPGGRCAVSCARRGAVWLYQSPHRPAQKNWCKTLTCWRWCRYLPGCLSPTPG